MIGPYEKDQETNLKGHPLKKKSGIISAGCPELLLDNHKSLWKRSGKQEGGERTVVWMEYIFPIKGNLMPLKNS